MKKSIFIKAYILLTIALTFCNYTTSQNLKPSIPNIKGYSLSKLNTLKSFLEKSGASSMMVLVDGDVIFEWGNTSEKHVIHSIRKPLIHSLLGIAVAEKKIDTSMTLKELNIDDIKPQLSDLESSARVGDLLKSKSGVYHLAAGMTKNMTENLPERDSYKPGEHYYNNWDFNTLGAILEQQTGQSIYELFEKQIAIPLAMKDY